MLRAFWILIFLFTNATGWLYASGAMVHHRIGQIAMKKLKSDVLKQILNHHYREFMSGTVYPDTEYMWVPSETRGEFSHWAKFLNTYMQHIRSVCNGSVSNLHCRKLIAHYMGSLTHSVTDFHFDRYFVKAVAVHDFNGDMDKAQTTTDLYMDLVFISENRHRFFSLREWAPVEDLVKVYKMAGKNVPASSIKKGLRSHTLRRELELLIAGSHMSVLRPMAPWGMKNYMDAKGGVYDCANVVADFLDQVWQILQEPSYFQRFPKVKFAGGWPNVSMSIHAI